MYLKLALRNTKRSMLDYLLYMASMVMLTSIIFLSNCIADTGDMQRSEEHTSELQSP